MVLSNKKSMKKSIVLVAMMLVAAAFAQSKVYLTREISPESLVRIYKALGVPAKGRVAVKMSTGEGSNPNYLKPELVTRITGTGLLIIFVINLVLSEYVCKFAIVKQFSCGIYGQTDTEDKRNRPLPRNKIRSLLWGRSQAVFPADGRFVWSYSETEK